jgi:hypothetical protein
MRKLLASAMLTCFAFMPMVASADYVKWDKAWWNALPEADQSLATQSLIQGFENGVFLGQSFSGGKELPDVSYQFSHTFRFYASAISDFYVQHPNTTASPGSIIECLADAPFISCDKLAKGYEKNDKLK